MSRMTLKAAVNRLKNLRIERRVFEDPEDNPEIFTEDIEAIDTVIEHYDKIPHWISVKERLPEKYGETTSNDVLITSGYGIFKGYYDFYRGQWDSYEDIQGIEITHWMPLPELPEHYQKE